MNAVAVAAALETQDELASENWEVFLSFARVLLEGKVRFPEARDMLQDAFVTVAKDIERPGRKKTAAWLMHLTDISRIEMAKSEKRLQNGRAPRAVTPPVEALVLHGWHSDPLFLTEEGKPRDLPMHGRGRSFDSLVKRHGSGHSYGPIADELIGAGSAELLRNGDLRAVQRGFVPKIPTQELRANGIMSTRRLTNTVAWNLRAAQGDEKSRYQQEIWTRACPKHLVDRFLDKATELLREQFEECNELLEEHEQWPPIQESVTLGAGYYLFVEDQKAETGAVQ